MNRTRATLVVLLAFGVPGCQSPVDHPPEEVGAADPGGLFEGHRSIEPTSPGMLRARLVGDVAQDLFAGERSPDSVEPTVASLRLNLFADATFDARLVRVQEVGDGVVWEGEIVGHEGGTAFLSVREGAVSGSVRVGARLFTIQPRERGLLIAEWDEDGTPSDAPSIVAPARIGPSTSHGFGVSASGVPHIDVLVVYTDEAADGVGGAAGLRSVIDVAVAETNTSYRASDVTAEIDLVGFERIAYDETGFDFEETIGRLQRGGDGFLDEVQALRDASYADHVVLIVDHAGPYAGIGFQMTRSNASAFSAYAYSVVSRDYAAGFYTFAHELGHNLGADHDPDHAASGYYDESRGHQDPRAGYRTIMAYSCATESCPRAGVWSNPHVDHLDSPSGIAGVSDNAATLDDTVHLAAAFRERPVPPPMVAEITHPTDGATLPSGPVTFRWTDTGADAYYLMIGVHPGDDSYFREHLGTDTEVVVEGLPERGETVYARLWTLRDGAWLHSEHSYTTHYGVFTGARIALPVSSNTPLPSTWSWFGWDHVPEGTAYRLEVGTAAEPTRYFERDLGHDRHALVLGLPSDGSFVVARLHTRGPDGWDVQSDTYRAWTAPADTASLLSPVPRSRLSGPDAVFRWRGTDRVDGYWLVVQSAAETHFVSEVEDDHVVVTDLPTDGRELYVILYTHARGIWSSTTATLLAAR